MSSVTFAAKAALIAVLAGTALAAAAIPDESVLVSSAGPGGGGWMECVVPSRHSPSRVFAGCDVGGFFVSEDAGRSFEVRNCGLRNYFVETVAEHPLDGNLLLLGGEGGVWRSTDRGRNWSHVSQGLGKPLEWGHSLCATAIVFDETNPDHAWLATGGPRARTDVTNRTGCVYESFDAGLTWRRTVADGEEIMRTKSAISSFSPNTANPNEMLLVNTRGVWRSEDGGRHWSDSNGGIPLSEGFRPRRLARSPSAPDVVYLAARQGRGRSRPLRGGIWKSTDGGRSWKACRGMPSCGLERAGMDEWQFNLDAVLAVDARDPNLVWAGGSVWYCPGVWMSADGCESFTASFNGPPQGWIDFWGTWTASLAASPGFPGVVAFGTSGTLYRSDTAGRDWRQIYTRDRSDGRISGNGLEVLCVRSVYHDPVVSNRVFIAFWDVGLFASEDGGRSFRRAMRGISAQYSNSCFAIAQCPGDSEHFFGTFGSWAAGAGDPRRTCVFAETTDAGRSWTMLEDASGWPGVSATALAIMNDCNPYQIVCAATEGDPLRRGIFLSRDSGRSWRRVPKSALEYADDISAVRYAGGRLYAGFYVTSNHTGRVAVSDDKGATWRTVAGGKPDEKFGTVTMIDVQGDCVAFAAHDWGHGGTFAPGGTWLSRDRGASWKRVFGGTMAKAVCFAGGSLVTSSNPCQYRDPGFDSLEGVYASDDGGTSWHRLAGDGFDAATVSDLKADPRRPSDIWVGTGGNSVRILRRGRH